jgi:hypothetical protein
MTWSLLALASSITTILLLTALGSHAQGPLGAVLTRLGTGLSEMESRVVRQVRGSGRASELSWFQSKRENAAWLRNPDVVLLGAFDGSLPGSLEGVVQLEQAVSTTLPLVQVYGAWGDKPEQRFPRRIADAIWEIGSTPVITWEPWLTDFENRLHPHLPLRNERDRSGLKRIAQGDYDFYIDAWAADAAAFGRPFFLRFAHEMNDPYRYPWGPQNNHPTDFIAAWRHVVERFRVAGATNVIWIWSPHVAHAGYEWFYPGDEYVDWVATGALNYGTVAYWSQWWTFQEIFGDRYEPLTRYGKPVMVAEFGSVAVGGDRDTWFREALTELPTRYPAVKAVLFFHLEGDATVTYQKLDWSFADDAALSGTVARAMAAWTPRNAQAAKPAGQRQVH